LEKERKSLDTEEAREKERLKGSKPAGGEQWREKASVIIHRQDWEWGDNIGCEKVNEGKGLSTQHQNSGRNRRKIVRVIDVRL